MSSSRRSGRDIVVRHGETIFNAARLLQGETIHTPLTSVGFQQADGMGHTLRNVLGDVTAGVPDRRSALTLWTSPTGRTLQTLAIIAEHLGLDWHCVHTDPRLGEIGMGAWGGRRYDHVNHGEPIFLDGGLLRPAPDGENYVQIADRLQGWLADTDGESRDRLIVSHGITSRVLRGLMIGAPVDRRVGAPVAAGLPQGSIALIENGTETIL